MEYLSYLGSIITKIARCTCEIQFRIAMKEQRLTRRLATSKLDLNLRKKVVKWYIWNKTLYRAET